MFKQNDSFYTIMFPDDTKKRVYFNKNNNYDYRLQELESLITDEWIEYCNDNWIDFNHGGFGINSEDKVKRFLEGLANLLLMRDSNKDVNILKKSDYIDINSREVHLDSYFDDENKPDSIEEGVQTINKHLKQLSTGDGKIIQPKPIVDKVAERRKTRTKLDKFNDIYGTQSNKYIDYIEDNRLPYMPTYWTEVQSNIEEVGGVINKNKPHKVKWVNVRVDRRFSFDNKTFRISENAKQYLYTGHTKRYETYRDDFKMIKVLCFEQYGKYYFYDENIDEITEMVELEN